VKYLVPVRVTILTHITVDAEDEWAAQMTAEAILENTPEDIVLDGAIKTGRFDYYEVEDEDIYPEQKLAPLASVQ
jgi:hypothetical protein